LGFFCEVWVVALPYHTLCVPPSIPIIAAFLPHLLFAMLLLL
jgi:hypothetical protein